MGGCKVETFTIKDLTFSYPNSPEHVLLNVNLSVLKGAFLTICGISGSGKSTLLRNLKPSIAPAGIKTGDILFEGRKIEDLSVYEQSARIGFVMQNPENQIVTDKVWHELAFGLESLGKDTSEIRLKVAEIAAFFGIEDWFHRNVSELSGGQKQILNLASVMIMDPSVLILDEPTSQLDPIMASEFLQCVNKINKELGITVIMTEHRLEEVLSISDRVIVMAHGSIIADGAPVAVGEYLKSNQNHMFLAMPTPMRVYGAVENNLDCPLTVRDGRNWLSELSNTVEICKKVEKDSFSVEKKEFAIEMKDIWFKYEKNDPDILKSLSFNVRKGEFYAILGGNGAGKSTALSLIAGINKPYKGKIVINGMKSEEIKDNKRFNGLIGILPQNPEGLFVKNTLRLDLIEMLDVNKDEGESLKRLDEVSDLCMLHHLLDRHPYDLSGGELQRAALAKILLQSPEILILDEPTKGMDAHFKMKFAHILKSLKEGGTTILMVSHDIEFCAEYADRCALFFDGGIIAENTPRKFFSGNKFYTTSASAMSKHVIEGAVTPNDLITCCGGMVPKYDFKDINYVFVNNLMQNTDKLGKETTKSAGRFQLSFKTKISIFIFFILIPVTLWFGSMFFGDRKYYFISMLVILETIIPFLIMFEKRRLSPREIVVISIICALGVAGRAAFFMVPQFKPTTAVIIIGGAAFGGNIGFLIGIVTAFVSNLFFGQGPWTPWQMLSLGLIGFLAGAIFRKGIFKRNKKALCIYGGLSSFFIYGGIMNPASVIISQSKLSLNMILLSYASGFIFDLTHAVSTVIFLFFISDVIFEKLDRIKLKYGMDFIS